MGFLCLAAVAIFTSMTLGHHTPGTVGSLIFGLVGGFYCSVRGIRVAHERGMYGFLMDGRRSRR